MNAERCPVWNTPTGQHQPMATRCGSTVGHDGPHTSVAADSGHVIGSWSGPLTAEQLARDLLARHGVVDAMAAGDLTEVTQLIADANAYRAGRVASS